MTTSVFFLGLDEQNHEVLRSMPDAGKYRFLCLLGYDELGQDKEVDVPGLLACAEKRLNDYEGSVDAIIGLWDFPVTSLVPLLCRPRGLRGASLEAVVRCEHKYWSRLLQRAVIPEAVPRFAKVDLDSRTRPEGLSYPLWVKPVKSFSSELAFRVTDDAEYREALDELRARAGRVGDSFQWVMDQVSLPPEIAQTGGTAGLVEEEVTGDQLTVEGYVSDGRPRIYGIVDSVCYPGTSSFLRYEYPSLVPAPVRERLTDLTERVITKVGLDNTTFNIEYFHDPDSDVIRLLEINPRHSQSHARLFDGVRGVSNHEIALRVALGEEPELDRGGEYAVAAKWFLRRFRDGVVSAVPTEEDIARAEERIEGTRIEVTVHEGEWMSGLTVQDSYSFELADIFVGARDPQECERKYRACVEALPFTIQDTDEEHAEEGSMAPCES